MLSDQDIKNELASGNVVIKPFDERFLNPNSYDIRLGRQYYASNDTTRIPKQTTTTPTPITSTTSITSAIPTTSTIPTTSITPTQTTVPNPQKNTKIEDKEYQPHYLCPWNQDSINQFWCKQKDAILLETQEDLNHYQLPNDFLHREIIVVPPLSTILGHTLEFIGGQHNITTMMEAKSTIGRCNITVCRCAGLGDVGFVNRWCMEIQNCCHYTSLILVVGQPIGQITFHYVKTPSIQNYKKRGRYQQDKVWSIEDIVPKAIPLHM